MNKTSFRRFAAITLTSLPLLLSAGCLKCDMILDLAKDGSGSLEVNYSISENSISQLDAFAQLTRQLDAVSGKQPDALLKDPDMLLFLRPEEEQLKKRLSAYQKNGLTVEKLRVSSNNARASASLSFTPASRTYSKVMKSRGAFSR